MKRASAKSLLMFGLVAFVLSLLGCGGGGGGGGGVPNPPSVTLSIQGQTGAGPIKLAYGTGITITARVNNSTNQAVTFTLSGGTGAKLTSSGDQAEFTAGTTTANYTVTATATVNGATDSVQIDVVPIAISISPKTVTLNPNGQIVFTATVQGSTNTASTFTASGGTLVPVSGSNDSATYTAPATVGTYTVTAKASVNGAYTDTATVTVTHQVLPSATVKGTVTDSIGNQLANVVVLFFDSSGNELTRATTGADGSFTASVPTNAVTFGLLASSIDTSKEYEAYEYNSLVYDPLIAGCNPPLPAITQGATVTLTQILVASNVGPPPPPPSGCS